MPKHPAIPVFARKLPLLDRDGEMVRWVNEDEARRMVVERRVDLLWSKRRVRALRYLDDDESLTAGGHNGTGSHYSHNRETEENPHGVWTFVPVRRSTKDLFLGIVADRLREAA